jgi:uncharacterized membrane protein
MASSKNPLRTSRGVDRFIFFTDAVVAVAITLLVLPLVDTASNIGATSILEYLQNNGNRIFAFVLSFAVVGRFWISHHQFSETITDYTVGALWLNMAWMLTIVFLPVPTELLSSAESHFMLANGLYIGTMLVNMILTLWLRNLYLRKPAMMAPEGIPLVRAAVLEIKINVVLLSVALVLSIAVPPTGMWTLLLLLLSSPLARLIRNKGWREPVSDTSSASGTS